MSKKTETRQMPQGELWKIEDAAAFLKTSVNAVYKRCEKGQIPFKKVNGTLYFSEYALRQMFL